MIDTQGAVYNIEDTTTGDTQSVYITLDEEQTSIIGDKINKANFLPDEVVESLGLTMDNPQVKDALLMRGTKYVVETGTEGVWTYDKWSDGTFTARTTIKPTITYTSWGTVQEGSYKMWGAGTNIPVLPSGFTIGSVIAALVSVAVPSNITSQQQYLRNTSTANINIGMIAVGTVSSFSAPTQLFIDVVGTWQ